MDQVSNEKKEAKKVWFNKNWKKIVFSLALVGATTGTIGLVLGSVSIKKSNELNYYLTPSKKVIWGVQTIWTTNPYNTLKKDYKFILYFADKPIERKFNKSNQNWYYSTDIKWDGNYPKGYFADEK